MPKILMTRGIPGSGKSTFAKEWLAESPETRVRVNRDGIRWTQGIRQGNGSKEQEETVTLIEKAIVTAALAEGKDVIIDSMNLNPQFTKAWFKLGYPVRFVNFHTHPEICIQRDAERERTVGEAIIRKIIKRYKIAANGSLPSPPRQPEIPVFEPAHPWDYRKNDAIIVDVDNTLAHMNGRGPYDTSKYHTDTLDENVAKIVNTLSETYYVLVTSGRSEDFREVTQEWLEDNNVRFDRLIMRKSGDFRNDSIVKHDLYHEFIAPEFNVIMAYDDRDRVVKAWRTMGIKTAQVEYGAF